MKLPKFVRTATAWVYLVVHLLIVMLGVFLTQDSQQQIKFGIGTSMIAGGISGWVLFLYLALVDEHRLRLQSLSESGVLGIFVARSVRIQEEYTSRLRDARDQIDVIGFGLSAFREDFQQEIPRWKENANVRILILDPDFPTTTDSYASQRDREERNPNKKIADECNKFVEDFARFVGKGRKGSLEIRKYQCLPTINILRVDGELFWGPYLVNQQSRNTPTFLVKRGGFLFEHFVQHFDYVWDHLSVPCMQAENK